MLANLTLKPAGGSSVFHSNLSMSKLTKQMITKLPLLYVDAINLFIQFAKIEDLSSNARGRGGGLHWKFLTGMFHFFISVTSCFRKFSQEKDTLL